MDLKNQDYYIGLDCGTNSVGWAVTDLHYNLLRFHGKDMWGSRIFDEAENATSRKYYRNKRRGLDRQKRRIGLLQDIFAATIENIDPQFFLRLNESALNVEDRIIDNRQSFSLFCDEHFTDKEYKALFPTIFHLRLALIDGTAPKDPRLVYLALHHILKNRGHFLFYGKDINTVMSLGDILGVLNDTYYEVFDETLDYTLSYGEIENLIKDKTQNSKEKLKKLVSIIYTGETTPYKNELLKLVFGYKVKLSKLFCDVDCAVTDIEFKKASYEESDLPILEACLDDKQFKLLEVFKQIFDWNLLVDILNGAPRGFISEAKIHQYNENKKDMKILKNLMRKYKPTEFKRFFYMSDADKGFFSNYIGSVNTAPGMSLDGKKIVSRNVEKCNTELFYKQVCKLLSTMPDSDDDVIYLKERIESEEFMVLLRSYRNGVVPYQVNRIEMIAILDSVLEFMPWLNVVDDDGFTPYEKILALLEFNVPYYVGPLSNPVYNNNAWIIRKTEGKILPWNFSDVVDEIASDECFVRRRTNKCSYLVGEDVIPKASLLYQKFLVLETINTLKINDVPISVEQKQMIYNDLFKNSDKLVTTEVLTSYIIEKGWCNSFEELFLSGIRKKINLKLSSYHLFKNLDLKYSEKEWIINSLTIHAKGGKLIESKLRNAFGERLTDDEIRYICRMRFKGWGRLSEKFLTAFLSDEDENGECHSIISLMWSTNQNLMQILNNKKYGFSNRMRGEKKIDSLSHHIVDESRLPPKVKRQVWQALKVVKEIEGIMGHAPKRIFVEVARYPEPEKKGHKPKSKKSELVSIFKNNKTLLKMYHDIYDELLEQDDNLSSKKDKLLLYFTQLGCCMYSGEPIDLNDIIYGVGNLYDIDHIYPYSKSCDDSLTNRVLVRSNLNRAKDNSFPIDSRIRNNMKSFWYQLRDYGLISDAKYSRLVRSSALEESDFEGFINRQLSDTRYSSKVVAHALENYFGSETKVIFSKARNVSDFRNRFGIYKSRSINMLHHGKDAYLNIVVGNVLYEKYTAKWFLKNVNFTNPYKTELGSVWIPEETISLVRRICFKNSVIFTRQQERKTGQLFAVNPVAKGSSEGLLPKKLSNPRLKELLVGAEDREVVIREWTNKYGGYTTRTTSHFALIRRTDRIGRVYHLIPIQLIRAKELTDSESLRSYCINELNFSDVEIVRPVVMLNTVLVIDGFRFTLIGGGLDRIFLDSAIPLILSNEDTYYVSQLEKCSELMKKFKNDKVFNNITVERNIELYEVLKDKSHASCYKSRPASQTKTFDNGLEKFKNLSVAKQVDTLLQMITYFGMSNGKANLSALGANSNSGHLKLPAKIGRNYHSFVLIDTSFTGLFENRTILV